MINLLEKELAVVILVCLNNEITCHSNLLSIIYKQIWFAEDDPIEVTSSISSVSSSIESDDDDRRENHSRRSSSRDRYSAKKRRLSPDDERRKYLYRNAGRRGISPSRRAKGSLRSRSRSRTRSRSRSRSRSRDRRCDYYRERDRLKRSPSYGRFRSGRLR